MTVGTSLINWLSLFEDIEGIQTEQLLSDDGSFALFKEPTTTITAFVDGSQDVTVRYYLLARQKAKLDKSRVNNQGWMESLEQWVRQQNRAMNFPVLDQGRECFGVEIAVGSYMAEQTEKTANYQLSVAISYTEGV